MVSTRISLPLFSALNSELLVVVHVGLDLLSPGLPATSIFDCDCTLLHTIAVLLGTMVGLPVLLSPRFLP